MISDKQSDYSADAQSAPSEMHAVTRGRHYLIVQSTIP